MTQFWNSNNELHKLYQSLGIYLPKDMLRKFPWDTLWNISRQYLGEYSLKFGELSPIYFEEIPPTKKRYSILAGFWGIFTSIIFKNRPICVIFVNLILGKISKYLTEYILQIVEVLRKILATISYNLVEK